MTLKQLYEAVLIELHKENAPNITLGDFNHYANKAYSLYINKRYNIYDINQQTTDDLRVLKSSAILPVEHTPYKGHIKYNDFKKSFQNEEDFNKIMDSFKFMEATYRVTLPDDYLHLLNCECLYRVKETHDCNNKGDVARAKATRLTADTWNLVVDNFWNKPEYYRPYYYIHNVNTELEVPTNPVDSTKKIGTDKTYKKGTTELATNKQISLDNYLTLEKDGDPFKTIDISGYIIPDPEDPENPPETLNPNDNYPLKKSLVRYGNTSKVLMEIRYGLDNTVYELFAVIIDYIKTPQHLRLTQEQMDRTRDISQTLEFPDYVCLEILNELVHIIMENISDPRLLTHPVVSLSIANPTQQLTVE